MTENILIFLINTWDNYLGDVFFSVVPFLIALSIVVFVHEFGHFIVARLSGVKVDAFSLGFGKELWGFTDKKGTRWKICPIPMGGYVQMFGDSDPASATASEEAKEFTEEEKKVAFWYKPLHKRFAIVAAGPIMNYIFGILIFAILFSTFGKPLSKPVVDSVIEESAAEAAGIMPDDIFLKINDKEMKTYQDVANTIRILNGKPLDLILERNGKIIKMTVLPKMQEIEGVFGEKSQIPLLGVRFAGDVILSEKIPVTEAIKEAFTKAYTLTAHTLVALNQMIFGERSSKELGGPIQIAAVSKAVSTDGGMLGLINFIALLSINLGLINLFPIPLLDGGHLVFYIIEGAIGREINEKIKDVCFRVGLGLLLGLMLFATYNDISKIFN